MKDMTQVPDVAFEDAIADLRRLIDESGRQAMAYILSTYPDRGTLNELATLARRALQTNHVQVNAIYNHHQITVGGSPHITEPISVPESDGLCVMTVGHGKPLAINDLSHHMMTTDVAEVVEWKSWASAPIVIEGKIAGSICALESRQSRIWTSVDQTMLERAASQVADAVVEWMHAA